MPAQQTTHASIGAIRISAWTTGTTSSLQHWWPSRLLDWKAGPMTCTKCAASPTIPTLMRTFYCVWSLEPSSLWICWLRSSLIFCRGRSPKLMKKQRSLIGLLSKNRGFSRNKRSWQILRDLPVRSEESYRSLESRASWIFNHLAVSCGSKKTSKK